jgi:hypothetical protein
VKTEQGSAMLVCGRCRDVKMESRSAIEHADIAISPLSVCFIDRRPVQRIVAQIRGSAQQADVKDPSMRGDAGQRVQMVGNGELRWRPKQSSNCDLSAAPQEQLHSWR